MRENIFFSALERKRYRKASRVLKDLREEVPRKRYLYLEGLLLEKKGKLDEALKRFDMALVLHLSDRSLWLAKARVLKELGKLEIAKRAAERACRLSREDPEGDLLYAEILYLTKEYQKAMEHIDRAISHGSESPEALTLKGILISILDQDFREALMLFDSAIEVDDNYPRAWTNRGIALRQIGDENGAVYSFQRALLIDPSDGNARKNLERMGHEDFLEKIQEGPVEEEEDVMEWD